jgi:hypothetical protein
MNYYKKYLKYKSKYVFLNKNMKGGAGDLFLIFKGKDNKAIYITTYPKRDIGTPTSFILFRMKLHDFCKIKRIHELINLASTIFFETRSESERFISIKHFLMDFSRGNQENIGTDREQTRLEDLTDDKDLYIYVQHNYDHIADLISLHNNGHFQKINDLEYNWVYEEPEKVPMTDQAIAIAAYIKVAEARVDEAVFVDARELENIAAKVKVVNVDTLETRQEKETDAKILLETAQNIMIELENLLRALYAYDEELKKNKTFIHEENKNIKNIIKIRIELDELKKKVKHLKINADIAKQSVEAATLEGIAKYKEREKEWLRANPKSAAIIAEQKEKSEAYKKAMNEFTMRK